MPDTGAAAPSTGIAPIALLAIVALVFGTATLALAARRSRRG
jgi:hypothetical protein